MSNDSTPGPATADNRSLYFAVWRWHFYAGLFVAPFLLILAASGMLMLVNGPIESWRYAHLMYVTPQARVISAGEQLAAVAARYPAATLSRYQPPRSERDAAQVSVLRASIASAADDPKAEDARTLTVFVNPYTAHILGELDPASTLYAWANALHGSLFLGDFGDHLIETAAGFGVLLAASGLFMWWPRDARWLAALRGSRPFAARPGWRNLHASIGFWSASALLLFLISGLAWTNIWGGELLQAWNSIPASKFKAPLAHEQHASLNRGVLDEVPWALEQTPLPASGSAAGTPAITAHQAVDLDAVVDYARRVGFKHFRVMLPTRNNGVWTVMASAMDGDLTDPREERTMHIDRHTGRVLADIRFADYAWLGKAMTAGVPLHQGSLGLVNLLLNGFFCVAIAALPITGILMWWRRRRPGTWRLTPPPMPRDQRLWHGAVLVMFVLSFAFPLVSVTVIAVYVIDRFVIARIQALRVLFE